MLRYPILPETAAKHFIMLSVHALMLRSWLAFGSELSLRELMQRTASALLAAILHYYYYYYYYYYYHHQ